MNFLPGWMPAVERFVAFPTVAATNTSQTNNASTSHTVALPSSISAGNLLIIVFGVFTATVSTPSGWTSFFNNTSGDSTLYGFWKLASGSEGASVTITTGASRNSAHNTYRITGWTGTPEAATATGSDTTPNPPSLTPSWGFTKTLWIAAEGSLRASASHAITAFPSGYSGGISATGTIPIILTSDVCGSAWLQSAGASQNPGAFTVNASVPWVAVTIGVRPA